MTVRERIKGVVVKRMTVRDEEDGNKMKKRRRWAGRREYKVP